MPNVRDISDKKYEISKARFRELYYHCLQYNEWKDELEYKCDTVKSIQTDSIPASFSGTDATAELAIKREILSKKCEIVEQTAMETDADIYQYILKAVTNEGIDWKYLYTVMGIPCSRNTYYDRRRKFYYLLSKKI